MFRKVIFTALAMILGVAIFSAVAKDKEAPVSSQTTAMVGQAAPDFALTAADGKSYSLSSFKGKYVVLEWVNFDCPFVKKHYGSGNMPKMQKMMADNGVVWLSICSSAPGKQGHFAGKELMERMKAEGYAAMAYLIDADGKVGRMYDAKTTPHMFVIDPKGMLIYAGAIDDRPTTKFEDIKGAANYIQAALESSQAGKEVTTRNTVPYGCSVKY